MNWLELVLWMCVQTAFHYLHSGSQAVLGKLAVFQERGGCVGIVLCLSRYFLLLGRVLQLRQSTARAVLPFLGIAGLSSAYPQTLKRSCAKLS